MWRVPLFGLLLLTGCGAAASSSMGVHPARPGEGRPMPIADPPPSRVTMHVSIFGEAIRANLDESLPKTGEGDVDLVAGKTLHYAWEREPLQLKFDRGRVVVTTNVSGAVKLLGDRKFSIRVRVYGEPVITPDYRAVMQSTEVEIKAEGSVESVNRTIEETLHQQLTQTLETFQLDVRPLVEQLYARIAHPIPIEGGCAELRVTTIEAGPTVLAGGMEKDISIVVLPSVTMPCARTSTKAPPLPLLANVASIPTGPFTVVVPVAAEYKELSRAMDRAINGKLFFSTEYPNLYLQKPEIYASDETIVIRLELDGTVELGGATTGLAGELFFSGHPRLIDNQITVPDLELTPGTLDALLRIKVLLDGQAIRDQAKNALRLDISERIQAVRDKLSTELTFSENLGCVRAELLRAEITGIYPHQSFLRVYVTASAQGAVYLPCKR